MTNTKEYLGNLLARIHRDGGQYQDKYGIDRAVDDADKIIIKLFTELDNLHFKIEQLRDLLRDCNAILEIDSDKI